MTQLVLGWDAHPSSSAALRFAVTLAHQLQAHLHVVHAADVDDLPVDPDAWDWERQLDHTLAGHETTARVLLDGLNAQWTYHAARGRASNVITALADDVDAVLIVVGASRGGLLSFVETHAGQSVSHQLTRDRGRPVLIVPQPDHTGDGPS